ncbi:MAG: hypothetical protein K9M45_02860, partial [Kiritimatiellales bacterium]|nr:hypothetical protein [Kiritimatiellales bacterium]
MPTCKYCNSENLVRAGKRTRKDGTARQLFLCKDCLRRSSNSNPTEKRTPPGAVLLTLTHYCQGYSYADIAYILKRKFRIRRTRSALCKWVREFDPPFLAIRERMAGHARPVRSFLFTHRELNYMYQFHRPKLRFAKRFPGLVDYLENIADRLDHGIFANASHCSNMRLLANPGLTHHTNTLL